MNTPTLVISLLLVICVLVIPRKHFLLPFVMAACMIPMDQRMILAGLDFTTLRFVVLFGAIRMFVRAEVSPIRWQTIDKMVFAWAVSGAVVYIIQWQSMTAVIYKAGYMFDLLGMYWIFRQSIRGWSDVERVVTYFAVFAILSAPLILFERVRHESAYAILGRTPTGFHGGRFRCAGAFPHSIMMGLFWTSVIPMFVAAIRSGSSKILHLAAIAAASVCIFLSASSTPLMALLAVTLLWQMHRVRRFGKPILMAASTMVLVLHLAMKAPVWHLISRVNVFGGSTGWHRFKLIDEFVQHWQDWFLFGCRDVASWDPNYYAMRDVTNQFILEGVRGGVVTMGIFMVLCFLGVKLPWSYSYRTGDRRSEWWSWGICIAVIGHIVSFLGVAYFGQILMLLYMTLAMVALVEYQSKSVSEKTNANRRVHYRCKLEYVRDSM